MKVPNGWQPWLVDPAADEKLGPAVNANLFVGAFVPDTTDAKSNSPVNLLLVLDDTRYGPTVTRASEFIKVKKRFASELSSDIKLICDLPDKSCALLKTPDGGQVYMEIFNVKGRVATVSATSTSASSSASEALRKAVQLFVEELRASNEN
ncbi:MAG TPA: hypothetical protein VL381_03890 [Rhodocyclaceae bacterium]|jgi:hypothetical protein|nr:hypothetical protein [Rhodocyclaceae bacterium]